MATAPRLRRSNLRVRLVRAATGPTARTAYVVIGIAGLAGLGLALFGPRRFSREILAPVRQATAEKSQQLWAEAKPLRDQIADLVTQVREQPLRETLVRNFQSWIGHFRAT